GNVLLNMSGGVNGELLLRGGQGMQEELHAYLRKNGLNHVHPGFVMEIGPEPAHFKCIVYSVAVDGFYGSSVELVVQTLKNALQIIADKGCMTVAVPALATGYGSLSITQFGEALKHCIHGKDWPFEELRVVVRNKYDL